MLCRSGFSASSLAAYVGNRLNYKSTHRLLSSSGGSLKAPLQMALMEKQTEDKVEVITLEDSPIKNPPKITTPKNSRGKPFFSDTLKPSPGVSPDAAVAEEKPKTEKKLMMNGYHIQFPPGVTPYSTQMTIMARLLRAFNLRQNAIIESPTGSGKTLALLTSALAWQAKEKDRVLAALSNGDTGSVTGVDDEKPSSSSAHQSSPSAVVHNNNTTESAFTDTEDDDLVIPGQARLERHALASKANGPDVTANDDSQLASQQSKSAAPDENITERLAHPRIYYGTRTHRQITQIVKELGRSPHHSSIPYTILASREHTCQNATVRSAPDKVAMCKQMINQESGYPLCPLYSSLKRNYDKPADIRSVIKESAASEKEAWDIEDIVDYSQQLPTPFCAYFAVTRVLLKDAELIICPYNYIVDPVIREAMQLNIGRNDIVIIDEAHNIEDTCRDAASFYITTDDTFAAGENIRQTEKIYRDFVGQRALETQDYATYCASLGQVVNRLGDFIRELHKDQAVGGEQQDRRRTQTAFASPVSSPSGYSQRPRSAVLEGPDVLVRLAEHKYRHLYLRAQDQEFKDIRQFIGILATVNDSPAKKPLPKLAPSTFQLLEKWLFFMEFFSERESDYRVFVEEVEAKRSKPDMQIPMDTDGYMSKPSKMVLPPPGTKTVAINLWCMNPGLVFKKSFGKARSVVLASGTLSPISTLQSELDVEFKCAMEGLHVIPKERVFASALSLGPGGRPLRATYGNTESLPFQTELGNLVLHVCRTVPSGVLCFLPSYRLLNSLVDAWRQSGILQQLEKCKLVLEEPKDGRSLTGVMEEFMSSISLGENRGRNGALLLAVHRGKVSEGLDFTDDSARAVISVGIPYPNVKDTKVAEKRRYNDKFSPTRGLLSGSDWYEAQAYRAMNQSLGRCVRHKDDWGALVLVDERFCGNNQTQSRYCTHVSRWIRNNLQCYNNYPEFDQQLTDFVSTFESESSAKSKRPSFPLFSTPIAKKPRVI